ncbi:nucleotidyltransferase domain-containing protein [Gemmatimonadota bacterium]
MGILAFGSWAREEHGQGSDIDILIVTDDRFTIDREVYRTWDEEPFTWHGHRVEPHFVHLLRRGDRISGLWAEVAMEGLVFFERGAMVSRRLGEIRRRIMSGEIVLRSIHGQSYWVEVG